jgi:hypothetical protein
MDPWKPEQSAGVVNEVPRWDKVRPVNNKVMPLEQVQRIVWIQPFNMNHDVHIWIQIQQALTCNFGLCPPDVLSSIDDLPLKVRQVDDVVIDDGEPTNAGRCKVQQDRATKTACPHHGHRR